MTVYYTYRKDVPLLPGQKVRFTRGKGYYAYPPIQQQPIGKTYGSGHYGDGTYGGN